MMVHRWVVPQGSSVSQASEVAGTGPHTQPLAGAGPRLLNSALRKVLFLIPLFREVYDFPTVPRSEWEGRDWKPGPSHTKASLVLAQVEADSVPEPTE